MSYIEELERLIFLLEGLDGVKSRDIINAKKLIKKSIELQKKTFEILYDSFRKCKINNDEEGYSYPVMDNILCQIDFINHFEQLDEEYRHNEAIHGEFKKLEQNKLSVLEPSGFTNTNIELHDCAKRLVDKAKALFKYEHLKAKVWSYRWDDSMVLTCDLFSLTSELSMTITISAVGRLMLDYLDEPEVYDMTEAVHLVGLITKALDAKVLVGRGDNEINTAILDNPLSEGQTNGTINLWKENAQ
jgi:hypothetical protein